MALGKINLYIIYVFCALEPNIQKKKRGRLIFGLDFLPFSRIEPESFARRQGGMCTGGILSKETSFD
jgi:hypothetical protein